MSKPPFTSEPPTRPAKPPPFIASPRDDNKPAGEIAAEEVARLRAELEKKDQEIGEMQKTFVELKQVFDQMEGEKKGTSQQLESLKMQLDLKNNQLGAVNGTIQSKDAQIATLNESLKLKDSHVQALNDSLSMKDTQIKTLQEGMKLKEDQITQIKLSAASSEDMKALQVQLQNKQKLLDEKNAQLEDAIKDSEKLKKEVDLLNQDLNAADELAEKLQAQLKECGGGGALDLEKVRYSREQITAKVIDILNKAIHNLTIVAPSILDLEDLKLFEIKSSVSVKVACNVEPSNGKHSDMLAEFESLDNISIRLYDAKDRWAVSRDNEEIFFTALGEKENLVFYSRDPLHIKIFSPMIMESWLRSRKL